MHDSNPVPGPLEKEIFFEALDRGTPEERAAFVTERCGNDPALRAKVAALLADHFQEDDFMDEPAVGRTTEITSTVPMAEGPGSAIGRYKLREKIGEGGWGAVYVAEQEQPVRRKVALKVIKLGMDTRQVVARFEAERQALAMMDHPNIAKVLDAGATESGRPYFVMELVRGIKITDYCDQNHLSTRARLELLIQVCRAVQHAHQKGIIHRDLKPSNILVTLHDGMPVPKVIDFGIAKATEGRLTHLTVYTELHQFMGTPAYMSPEQAEMSGLDVDTRSDIYSLGVLLYEMLTGKTPFDPEELVESGLEAMRKTIREKDPVRPSTRLQTLVGEELEATAKRHGADALRLASQLRGDLDWIVMKCLEKDRTRRYETANALAMDLERHLTNQPVLARPPSKLYEFQKTFRRHRVAFIAIGLGILLLTFGVALTTWLALRATSAEAEQYRLRQKAELSAAAAKTAQEKETDQRRAAEQERKRAETQEVAARKLAYAADMNLAYREWHEGNLAKALELLDAHRPEPAQSDIRGWEWRLLWMLTRGDQLYDFAQLPAAIRTLAISSDGKLLATGLIKAFGKGGVRLWDTATRRQVANFEDALGSVAFSPVDSQIAYWASPGLIKIWDPARKKLVHQFPTEPGVPEALAFSRDGRLLAFAQATQKIAIARLEDGSIIASLATRSKGGLGLGFINDDRTLVFVGIDGLQRWSAPGWSPLDTGNQLKGWKTTFALSPDGSKLALGEKAPPLIEVIDLEANRPITKLATHAFAIEALAFSPDGKTLASGSGDHTVKLWDASSWKEISTLQGSLDEVFALTFSPNGRLLFSGAKDGTVKVWAPQRAAPKVAHARPPDDGRFWVPMGSQVPISWQTNNHTLRVWDPVTLESQGPFRDPLPDLNSAAEAVSPSGNLLLVAARNGDVIVWDLPQERQAAQLRWVPSDSAAGGISADGKRFAFANADRVTVWDVNTLHEVFSFAKSPGSPAVLSLDRTGDIIAVGGVDGTVEVFGNGATHLGVWKAHHLMVRDIAFLPGGKQMVTSSRDSTLKVWDLATQKDLGPFERTKHAYRNLAVSPDGLRLAASAAGDKYVRVWDLPTHRELMRIQVSSEGAFLVNFSADGSTLLIQTETELTRWRAPSWEEINAAEAKERSRAWRN